MLVSFPIVVAKYSEARDLERKGVFRIQDAVCHVREVTDVLRELVTSHL